MHYITIFTFFIQYSIQLRSYGKLMNMLSVFGLIGTMVEQVNQSPGEAIRERITAKENKNPDVNMTGFFVKPKNSFRPVVL